MEDIELYYKLKEGMFPEEIISNECQELIPWNDYIIIASETLFHGQDPQKNGYPSHRSA